MNRELTAILIFLLSLAVVTQLPGYATGQEPAINKTRTLEEVKAEGALRSRYQNKTPAAKTFNKPQANLLAFRRDIQPLLKQACYDCHGAETAEGDFRVDTLDPDLLHGDDISWWLELSAAVTNEEMPPEDGPTLTDADRNRIIEWLSTEIQNASQVRRAEQGHSSFRRMTRYEYNYALQDLLGLPLEFAKDLPPDPVSEDGFKNSSEVLQMTAKQYADYLELNRNALDRVTVRGERPEQLHWCVSAEQAATRRIKTRQELDKAIKRTATNRAGEDPDDGNGAKPVQALTQEKKNGRQNGRDRSRSAHYMNTDTGNISPAKWSFRRAVHAWAPSSTRAEAPEPSDYIVVLPTGQRFVVELGNRLPDNGTLRVRMRAWRVPAEDNHIPSVALEFGWQGSNNSKASVKISSRDILIDATPDKPQFYQWDIPLSEIYPRNPVRKSIALSTPKMTNPSEYIRLHNTSLQKSATIQFDYIEVSAPVYEQWPPASHREIFIESENSDDEDTYAREILSRFMKRAWRRNVTDAEVNAKLKYFKTIRPVCEDFQQATIEVLATVLSSPRFLYLVHADQVKGESQLDEFELATRLSMFLWCSTPDQELLDLAANGQLSKADELTRQTKRMLSDPRHLRFSKHFVRQWLDMGLLNYLTIDKSTYPRFDDLLKLAMQEEPIAFFDDVLETNSSVIDFIHAEYALVNDRLAQHYNIQNVTGNHFRKVPLGPNDNRGGLLTQAGLLAMNSDGTDSHPLKRGIWLLESLLNDPPPPPPPAVPEIDLADPEILKMTLKQRIENHRDSAACKSCHMKIDPWGIAFENFDAAGNWRTKIQGEPVDAASLLYNRHKLDGMDGLKRYLLANRQDQFAQAMVHKLATFALGRPLTFADRVHLEKITAKLRQDGDGLQTLILQLVTSELFKSN